MPTTTREEREQWITEGIEAGATHVVVFCDTFSYEDYPVLVMPGQDVRAVEREHLQTPMTRTMEVIDLAVMGAVRGKGKLVEAGQPAVPIGGDALPTDLGAEVDKL